MRAINRYPVGVRLTREDRERIRRARHEHAKRRARVEWELDKEYGRMQDYQPRFTTASVGRRRHPCKGCRGHLDDYTEGCSRCYHRHYQRQRAFEQQVAA
jgi:hypothetical protein